MTKESEQITLNHIDQLFTSDDVFHDLFTSSNDTETQQELGSVNQPEDLPLPDLCSFWGCVYNNGCFFSSVPLCETMTK
jgi:hypothetical protein